MCARRPSCSQQWQGVILLTAVATLSAFLYNMSAALLGGIFLACTTAAPRDACSLLTPADLGPAFEAALKGAHAIQNLGAVQTYMRRYLWVTAMEIVENDYLDHVHNKNAPAPAAKPASRAAAPAAPA